MAEERFKRLDVKRSFRKFNDCIYDISVASFGTWDDAFRHLMNHCERDPVMRVVIDPLRRSMIEETARWLEVRSYADGLRLPDDDEERLATYYQLMLKVYREEFLPQVLGPTIDYECNPNDSKTTVYSYIIRPFGREVSYRLDEIQDEIAENAEVDREALTIFNIHGPSQTITVGDGSIVAVGDAKVSSSHASSTQKSDSGPLVASLKSHLEEVASEHRNTVLESINLLARAIDENTVPRPEVVEAVKSIGGSSSRMASVLRELKLGVSSSVIGSYIYEGLKAMGMAG